MIPPVYTHDVFLFVNKQSTGRGGRPGFFSTDGSGDGSGGGHGGGYPGGGFTSASGSPVYIGSGAGHGLNAGPGLGSGFGDGSISPTESDFYCLSEQTEPEVEAREMI